MRQISNFLQRRLLRCRGTLRVPAGTCSVPLRISTRKEFPKAGSGLWQSAVVFAIALVMLLSSPPARADYRALNEKGNKALTEDKADEALKYYKDAEVEKPKQPVLDYNIGSALYKQNKYPEALQRYTRALNTDDPKFQADAYYNSGNTLFRAQRYAEAISAYKKSLEINTDDADAKYNLELARVKLKEQAQKQDKQQQNQQDEQDNQDKQQQDNQQQDQQKQDPQQQDQQQQDQQKQGQQQNSQDQQDQKKQQEQQQQQNQQDQQKNGQEQQQQQQDSLENNDQNQEQQQQKGSRGEQQKMSKQDADRILNAISGDEKDLQKQLARFKVGVNKAGRSGKDW
jgi:Ca-activated chloride channel family protein